MKPSFPYQLRKYQDEVVAAISDTMESGSHLVMESGTGTGKTISTLYSYIAMEKDMRKDRKLLYLTHTNSQQKQVFMELRALGGSGIGLQGRKHTCPLSKEMGGLESGNHEELSLWCSQRKKNTRSTLKGHRKDPICPYFMALMRLEDEGLESLKQWMVQEVPTTEELVLYCKSLGICPYEVAKVLAKDMEIIAAPYVYFFNPYIQNSLLNWINRPLQDLIVVVDEAHNLPSFARENATLELSDRSTALSENEAREWVSGKLLDIMHAGDFCSLVGNNVQEMVDEYVPEDDGFIPPTEFRARLMGDLKLNSIKLQKMVQELISHGEVIIDQKREAGKLPRSHIRHLGAFLSAWFNLEDDRFVKLGMRKEGASLLQAYCMDPSLITSVLNQVSSSIHISGTLEPLGEYRDSIGLQDSISKVFPSPFPPENRILFYAEDVTTKYEFITRDNSILSKYASYIDSMIKDVGRNTVFFFPSFSMMESVLGMLKPRENVFIERREMGQEGIMELVREFKNTKAGVLFSVMGGRLSEGLDYPGRTLEVVVVIGIPYPKPTAKQRALMSYYDCKFGKGWDYAVKAPTIRRVLQSIGRLIRSEEDIGAAVILDHRAVHFKEYLGDLTLSQNIIQDLEGFFPRNENQ